MKLALAVIAALLCLLAACGSNDITDRAVLDKIIARYPDLLWCTPNVCAGDEATQAARQQHVTELRAWAQTLPAGDIKDSYLQWADFHQKSIDSMTDAKAIQAAADESARWQKELADENAEVAKVAPTIPSPP